MDVNNLGITVLGDSHSLGFPGAAFKAALENAGAVVTIDGRVGRAAIDLVGKESQHVTDAIASQPDVLVYWLGTNDGPTLATSAAFRQLHDQATAAGITEVWEVGPPSFSDDATASDGSSMVARSDANAATITAIFGDRFIDSRPSTAELLEPPDRTSDLLHFNAAAGGTWGRAAAQQLQASSATSGSVTVGKVLGVAAVFGAAFLGWKWWKGRRRR